MNKVILMGNFGRDPEIKYSTGENASAVARWSLAVSRRFKNAEGNYDTDWINCVAFGKTAEFIEKYFKQGSKAVVAGRIQTGSYTNKDGNKVYTTDVVVEEIDFAGAKGETTEDASSLKPKKDEGFINIPDGVEDEGLPF